MIGAFRDERAGGDAAPAAAAGKAVMLSTAKIYPYTPII